MLIVQLLINCRI